MSKSLTNLLISEITAAKGYWSRLHKSALNLKNQEKKNIEDLILDFYFDLRGCMANTLLDPHVVDLQDEEAECDLKEINKKVSSSFELLKSLCHISEAESKTQVYGTVNCLNLFYEHAHDIHAYLLGQTNIEIAYPRLNLLDIVEDDLEEQNYLVPLFTIPEDTIDDLMNNKLTDIAVLEDQRKAQYEKYLSIGSKLMLSKEPVKASEAFLKALKYMETAEAITLYAWSLSLSGDVEAAKENCLKAIKLDPDYGPPYNDLGSYLLAQGQVDESFKWFSLAKKAPHYENREYPFINCGRAYMAKKDFQNALKEFSLALAIAPYHKDLQETVEKIKNGLKKNPQSIETPLTRMLEKKDDNLDPPPVF